MRASLIGTWPYPQALWKSVRDFSPMTAQHGAVQEPLSRALMFSLSSFSSLVFCRCESNALPLRCDGGALPGGSLPSGTDPFVLGR